MGFYFEGRNREVQLWQREREYCVDSSRKGASEGGQKKTVEGCNAEFDEQIAEAYSSTYSLPHLALLLLAASVPPLLLYAFIVASVFVTKWVIRGFEN